MTNLNSLKVLHENIKQQLKIISEGHDNLVKTHNGEMIRGRKAGKRWTRKDFSRQSQNRPDFQNIKKAKQEIKKTQKKRNQLRRKLEDSQDSEYMDYINNNPSELGSMMKNYDSDLSMDKQVLNKGMDMEEISRRLLGLRPKITELEQTQEVNRNEFLAKNPSNLRVESDTLKEAKAVAKKVRMAGKVKIEDQTPIDASILNPAEDPTVDTNQGKVNVEINYQGKVTDVESPNENQTVAADPQQLRGSAPKANPLNVINDGGERQHGGSENNNESENKGNSPLADATQETPITTQRDNIESARGPNETSENTSEAQANTQDILADQVDNEINNNRRSFYGDDPTNNVRNESRDREPTSEPMNEAPRKYNDSGERTSEPAGSGIFIDNPANDDIQLEGTKKKGPRLGIIIDAEKFIKQYLSKMHSDAMGDNSSESGCGCDDKGKPKHTAEHLGSSNCPILVKSGGLRHVKHLGTGQVIKAGDPTVGAGYIQDPKLRRDIRTGLSYTTNARVIHRYPTEFKIK